MRLRQDLKAIADAQHMAPAFGKRLDLAHDGRMCAHCAGAQIIAEAKTAWQDDQIKRRQGSIAMPKQRRLLAADKAQRLHHIALSIRPWEDDNARFHYLPPPQA